MYQNAHLLVYAWKRFGEHVYLCHCSHHQEGTYSSPPSALFISVSSPIPRNFPWGFPSFTGDQFRLLEFCPNGILHTDCFSCLTSSTPHSPLRLICALQVGGVFLFIAESCFSLWVICVSAPLKLP